MFGTNQKSEPREKEGTGRVVDDIHLPGVEPWRKGAERQVQLKDTGLALTGIQLC